MGDIAERVTAAKKQVEDLKKQVASAKNEKLKGYIGINKMGKISHYIFILLSIIWWTQINHEYLCNFNYRQNYFLFI